MNLIISEWKISFMFISKFHFFFALIFVMPYFHWVIIGYYVDVLLLVGHSI